MATKSRLNNRKKAAAPVKTAPAAPPPPAPAPVPAASKSPIAPPAIPSAQTPPPSPVPSNDRQKFNRALEAIFSGKLTPDNLMYYPLARLDTSKEVDTGVVVIDRIARELFSLSRQLIADAAQVPHPKNPGQMIACQESFSLKTELSKQAIDLFWHRVRSDEKLDDLRELGVRINWRVVEIQELSEGFESLFGTIEDMPGLRRVMEELAARRRDDM